MVLRISLLVLVSLYSSVLAASMLDSLPHVWQQIRGLTIGLSARAGNVLPTNQFVTITDGEDAHPPEIRTLSLSITKRVSGNQAWHGQYANPQVGFGISKLTFGLPDEIGEPVAVFGLFEASPLHFNEKLRAGYSLEAGLAFGWNAFDPILNPSNVAIGAKQSAHFRFATHLDYALTQNITLELDGGLCHWSNGALRKPNLGINAANLGLTVRYAMGRSPQQMDEKVQEVKSDDLPVGEFTLGYFYGLKYLRLDSAGISGPDVPSYFGLRYPMMGLQVAYSHRLGPIGKLGVTMSLDYDAAVRASAVYEIEPDASPGEGEYEQVYANWRRAIAISVAPSYTLVVGKTEVLLQVGGYLARSRYKITPAIYQRVGIRHYVWHDAFIGASLRAYGGAVSEVIEWNVGWRIKRG